MEGCFVAKREGGRLGNVRRKREVCEKKSASLLLGSAGINPRHILGDCVGRNGRP